MDEVNSKVRTMIDMDEDSDHGLVEKEEQLDSHDEGAVQDEIDEQKLEWESKQDELKTRLMTENSEDWQFTECFDGLEYIGGVDLSFVKEDDVNACACLVVCSFPDFQVEYTDCTMVKLTAPYIPGFLAFREVGFLVDCIDRLKASKPDIMPQVILVDGNGLLHPRAFGTACHLGVLTDIPCIGVAKKLFQIDGLEKNEIHHEKIIQLKKGGDTFPLVGDSGQVHGMALRGCDKSTNPIYISIGHRIDLQTAVRLIHQCCKHRIPEPVRQADIQSREYLRQHFQGATDIETPAEPDHA